MPVHGPTDWAVFSTPAISVQASASKAAAPALAHVCTSITAVLADTALRPLITVNLRDGATGAGTILWSISLAIGTAGGQIAITLPDLGIRGSINTVMTLEFSAAGAATTTESVAMTGYDTA